MGIWEGMDRCLMWGETEPKYGTVRLGRVPGVMRLEDLRFGIGRYRWGRGVTGTVDGIEVSMRTGYGYRN